MGKTVITKEVAAKFTMQPTGSIEGAAIEFTTRTGYWDVVDRAGITRIAKGFEVKSASAGGNLCVHLVGDVDSAGANEYLVIEIVAGAGMKQREGWIFDEIKDSGTTIEVDDLTILF